MTSAERIPATEGPLPAAGSPEAEREALYADLQPLVRRLIRQYGTDPELRQDLPGEIYCRFCRLLEDYDPTRGVPLKPYLVSKLTSAVYTFARSNWRRERREVGLDAETGAVLAAQPEGEPEAWEHEERLVEVLRQLPAVLARVPPRQRQVVVARFYEGRSFEDIAEILGVQPATARSLLRHGLNRMRAVISAARSESDGSA
jgi:RNA polymerase sigma factor (sigma-70 family)